VHDQTQYQNRHDQTDHGDPDVPEWGMRQGVDTLQGGDADPEDYNDGPQGV
jgi:hypothetical protein